MQVMHMDENASFLSVEGGFKPHIVFLFFLKCGFMEKIINFFTSKCYNVIRLLFWRSITGKFPLLVLKNIIY